jgi:glycosyltransferase involved in cell wall biosynthesis
MEYQRNIVVNLKYVTHVVVADEIDVARFGDERQLPAMWLPIPVPKRFIINDAPPPRMPKALFSGLVYGSRARFLADPTLSKLLYHFVSPENRTLYPTFFNALPMHCYHRRLQRGIAKLRVILHSGRSPEKRIAYPRLIDIETNSRFPVCSVYTSYLRLLRHIRRQLYSMYLDGLQSGCAVVNLPSLFKSYSSRVVEGMAAGRPVISWQIPDRPQVNALFEDGQEILLFSKNDPSHLAAQIQRVLSEPDLSRRIVTNARRKIRQFHTIETRVRQILDWVETGTSPVYY